jgi:XTP/dITP diphosphohydrolase
MHTLYLGTTNAGKVAEFGALLAPLGVKLVPVSLDVPEVGDTFEANAREKGLAYAAHTGGLTLAEDSGLLVPALEGLPGPWSARYADLDLAMKRVVPSGRHGEEMDRANNERLLAALQGVEMPRRAAMFRVVLVVTRPGEVLFEAAAECHGWIAPEARGTMGFGYDPVFVGQDTFGKTYAEIDPVRKNLRSHRKRVLDELFMWLSQRLETLQ